MAMWPAVTVMAIARPSIAIPIIAVRTIIVRAPPAPAPFVTDQADMINAGGYWRGRRDWHGIGPARGEHSQSRGRCKGKKYLTHGSLHQIHQLSDVERTAPAQRWPNDAIP